MDLVSDAISAVRVGRPSSDRVRVGGTWCARLDPYDGAGFHVVLKGGCWLLPDGGEPVALGAGDAVLLPHGTGHVIADSPADAATVARAVPFTRWADRALPQPPLPEPALPQPPRPAFQTGEREAVSYTHLTLPTICSV